MGERKRIQPTKISREESQGTLREAAASLVNLTYPERKRILPIKISCEESQGNVREAATPLQNLTRPEVQMVEGQPRLTLAMLMMVITAGASVFIAMMTSRISSSPMP